jgi:RND superfamily putative drug exporter
MFGKLALVMYRLRWVIVVVWLVILAVAATQAVQLGKVLNPPNFDVNGSDSQQAASILNKTFQQDDAKINLVIVRNDRTKVDEPAYRRAVQTIVARLRADRNLPIVRLDNPLVTHNQQLISRDRHGLVVLFSTNLSEKDMEDQIEHVRSITAIKGFTTYVAGAPASAYDLGVANKEDLGRGEGITVPIVMLILLLLFGTAVGMAVPVVLALFSIVLSLALVFVFGHVIDVSIFVTNVVTTLGLGIAIDYSLFIVFRFREELIALDGDVEAAVVQTMNTAGRAVFFSGLTVAIGLSTLMLTNLSFMRGMGLGGVLVPVCGVLVTMTLLPAVLGLLGTKINAGRVVPKRFLVTGEGGAWRRIAFVVMARPWLSGGIVLLVMFGLIYPVSKLDLAFGSQQNAPKALPSVAGFLYMQSHFNTTPDPDVIVLSRTATGTGSAGGSLLQPAQRAGLAALVHKLRQDPEVRSVTSPLDFLVGNRQSAGTQSQLGRFLSRDGRSAIISVVAKDDSGTTAARKLVERIRDTIVPHTAQQLPGDRVYVGGTAPRYLDFDTTLYNKFPLVIIIVLVLTYVFLLFAFESLFLPLKAVLLNLLSVGAAYGLLQLVFQHGVASSLLGFTPESGIASWVPVFLFAFLFGLSMDYEVFLLSRMREGWLSTGKNRESVAFGLEKTGRLITSAAAIMVVAFSGFLLGREIQLKEFGFGLMASIALDATLVRIILVPAIMELSGSLNWWLPAFMRDFVGRVGLAENDIKILAPPAVARELSPRVAPIPLLATFATGPTPPAPSVTALRQSPLSTISIPTLQRPRALVLEQHANGTTVTHPLHGVTLIGRWSDNDIVLDDAKVSRCHAQVAVNDAQATARDLTSANGTLVNGRPITGDCSLQDGDTITVGETTLVFHDQPAEQPPRLVKIGAGPRSGYPLSGAVGIGRARENDIVLDDPKSSRRHALIAVLNGDAMIRDLNTPNGTAVNGTLITTDHQLHDGDTISIGDSAFFFRAS